jgi:hypothetical protein
MFENLPEDLIRNDPIPPGGARSRRATPRKHLILRVLILSWCIFRLEKTTEIRYSEWCRRFAVRFPPNRPALSNQSTSAKCTRPEIWLCARSLLRCPLGVSLGDFGLRGQGSLRHVSLRETGWSRNPTSSGRSRPESKGKATYGEVPNQAFPQMAVFDCQSA